MPNKTLDFVINNPSGPLLDHTPQIILVVGLVICAILIGIAFVIHSWRN